MQGLADTMPPRELQDLDALVDDLGPADLEVLALLEEAGASQLLEVAAQLAALAAHRPCATASPHGS